MARFTTESLLLRRLLCGNGCLGSLRSGLESGSVTRVGLVVKPAPASLVVLSFAFEDRLAISIEALSLPTRRAHAFVAACTRDTPFRSGLRVATHIALGCLLVVLDPPLVGVLVGAVGVGVRSDVCYAVPYGAAFGGGRRHGCRHVDAVVVMLVMFDDEWCWGVSVGW